MQEGEIQKRGHRKVLNYRILAIGINDDLFSHLHTIFSPSGFRFSDVSSVHEVERLLEEETIHLLIVDLDHLRSIQQSEWLAGIRRISFVPVVVLSNTPEEDFSGMVQLGADICIPNQLPHDKITEIVMAQLLSLESPIKN